MIPNFTTNLKGWRLGFVVAVVLLALGFTIAGPVSSALAQNDPNQITFTLEGCRNDGSITFPPAGPFVCPDAAYTTGNLGKGWNELDLVPHRVTLRNDNGNQSYRFIVAGDNTYDPGSPEGWDVISELTLNATLSDDSCPAAVSGAQTITPSGGGVGGADTTIYRTVDITNQLADSTCVYDYYHRLAVGSSDFSGSSLQSNLWNQNLGSQGIGQKRISIPVKDILPQELEKGMQATQDAEHIWNIAKVTDPASVNFDDTCGEDPGIGSPVAITITWTKLPVTPSGDVTIVTTIEATNPASRAVDISVTDTIFSGLTPLTPIGTDEQNPYTCPTTTVPANSMVEVCTHTITVAQEDAIDLNDEAIATYIDTVTGVDIEQTTTATATADVQPSGITLNETATITDTESIVSDNGLLSYSVDSFSGAGGAFDGYTAGTITKDPVVWTSDVQSNSGSVTLFKTVYFDEPTITSGTLSDFAVLTASDNFTARFPNTGTVDIGITTDALFDLTINKYLGFAVANDTLWKFKVEDSEGNVVASRSITIPAGSSSGSADPVTDLATGTYTVTEIEIPPFWVPSSNPQDVNLALPDCEDSVDFTNNPAANFYAQVEVKKITDPTGEEAGWTFDLTGPENAQVTTIDENFIAFNLDGGGGANPGADAGSYSIAEQTQAGWDLQADIIYSKVGCIDPSQDTGPTTVASAAFTVEYERDAGCTFQYTFKNVKRGTIIVEKATDPEGSDQSFEFTGDANGFLLDGEQIVVGDLVPDTYTSTEIVPADWDLTAITCDDGSSTTPSSGSIDTATATFNLDPGETVTCVFSNRCRGDVDVTKTVEGQPPTGLESFDFEIRQGASPEAVGTVVAAATTDATSNVNVPFVCADGDPPCRNVEGVAKLVPGVYQFCEANVYPGYTTDIKDWPNAFSLPVVNGAYFVPNAVDPMVDNSIYCVDFTLEPCATVSFAVDNTPPPGGDARTPGYWKNWSECTGGGQEDVLGESIACSDMGFFPIGLVQVDECYEAVSLLDMRQIALNLKGKKMASDACYLLASKLLAAELNTTDCIGAKDCPDLQAAMAAAQELLVDKGFDGANKKCLTSKDAGYSDAIQLAEDLDDYLNNIPGSFCN
jgi:hypothetical protein